MTEAVGDGGGRKRSRKQRGGGGVTDMFSVSWLVVSKCDVMLCDFVAGGGVEYFGF